MTTEEVTTERFLGQVKFFNRERAFGFITRIDDKTDFFVHLQDIKTPPHVWTSLTPGEYVDFETRQGPNGVQAGNVTGVRGGSLMCEHNITPKRSSKKNHRPQEETKDDQ